MKYQAPKGTQDILPDQTIHWTEIKKIFRSVMTRFGAEEIITPIFEETEIFVRGVGKTSDIVTKEMYTFEDKAGRSMTLRPEGTAPVVRAYLEKNLAQTMNTPVRLFYIGPMFRYEQPQAGRYRQHTQYGVEIFGSSSPYIDAELISAALLFYCELGLEGLDLEINSVGCPECRAPHRESLTDFLNERRSALCSDCTARIDKNPLRVFDCKNESCQKQLSGAPTMLDNLCEKCKIHFDTVKMQLENLDISYILNPRLVRGLDYYTHTAFEITAPGLGAQKTVCGGGRYDGLIEILGGPPTPGIGFGAGIERLMLVLESQKKLPAKTNRPDVVFVCPDSGSLAAASRLQNEIRKGGLICICDYEGRSFKKQLQRANKLNSKYVAIIGEDELSAGTVALKDMETGEQESIKQSDLLQVLISKSNK